MEQSILTPGSGPARTMDVDGLGNLGGGESTGGTGTMGTSGSVGSMGSATSSGMGGAGAADMQRKIDKVAEPAHQTVDRLSSAAHHTVDKLACGASGMADRFSDQVHWISETPPRVLASSKSWIQEKPLQAVGIALAAGYFMGRMRSVRPY